MCHEFYKQYKYNTKVDITWQDLETTKQDSSESFHAFITRWRTKAAQMTIRPNEEEQLNMIVKNLLPTYDKYLFARYFPSFKTLIATRTQIEDAINNGGIIQDLMDQQIIATPASTNQSNSTSWVTKP